MKRIICSILAFSLMLPALCGSAQAVTPNSSSGLITTALSQLDYEEGAKSYSKYGQWYGIPNGDWCDMFVSWCANEAGIPKSVFPRSAGCTTHVRLFSQIGSYYISAARGGTYVPKQGDIIFFYTYPEYPKADVVRHVGIILCVENGYVFTIEGNTLTNRLDYSHYESVDPLRDYSLEPQDYVAVKRYPLDEPQIHGYFAPNYGDTSTLAHTGWVDLSKYESLRGAFDALAAQGIMPGTSSYTFSPRYGMTRGEFLASIMELYGMRDWEAGTEPFDDVPESSAYYSALMAARSAGIIAGTGSNQFLPDLYISGAEVQTVISRTLDYVGLENQTFDFSEGDFSYLLTPYTIRADIANALYTLLSDMSIPVASSCQILFQGAALDWPVLSIDGSSYVPAEVLSQLIPTQAAVSDEEGEDKDEAEDETGDEIEDVTEVEAEGEAEADVEAEGEAEDKPVVEGEDKTEIGDGDEAENAAEVEDGDEAENAAEVEDDDEAEDAAGVEDESGAEDEESEPPVSQPVRLPVPMQDTDRVFLSSTQLQNGDAFADVPAFTYHGIPYVMLSPAASLLNVGARWNAESRAIELFYIEQ